MLGGEILRNSLIEFAFYFILFVWYCIQEKKNKKKVKKVSDIDDNCLAWFSTLAFSPYLTSIQADTHVRQGSFIVISLAKNL